MSKKWMDAMIIPYPPSRPARTCTFECKYSDGSTSTEVTGERVVSLTNRFRSSPATSITVSASPSAAYHSDASCVFTNCESLASLTLPAGFGAKITNARTMFNKCSSLASLTLPSGFGASVTDTQSMFSGCYSLASLTLPVGFGANVRSAYGMFDGCSKLTQILAPKGVTLEDDGSNGVLCVSVSFSLSDSPLDADSVAVVIKSLPAVANARTLKLSSTAYAHVTDALRGIANTKNWTVASA